jgi:Tol biopolymer transport system component
VLPVVPAIRPRGWRDFRMTRVFPGCVEIRSLIGRTSITAGLAGIVSVISAALLPSEAVAAFPGENGRIAYSTVTGLTPEGTEKVDLLTILPDGSGLQQLTDDSAFDDQPSWSADGRRLVYTRSEGGRAAVVTIAAAGGAPSLVVDTGNPFSDLSPAFSPSGRRIVYTTWNAIRTVRADGTKPRRVVRGPELGVFEPAYSPDGKRIAFAGTPRRKSKPGIWSVRRDGSRLRRLTKPTKIDPEFSDASPDYSPDGRHIVFTRVGYRESLGLRVMRADGSRERRVPGTDDAGTPAYAPAGDRIAMTMVFVACIDLYTISPTGSDKRALTHNCDPAGSGGQASSPSWQPLPAN